MVIFYSQKRIQLTQQQKILLEREYGDGGGSMFEFRAKMTVVKKTANNKRLVFYNPLWDINNALYLKSVQLQGYLLTNFSRKGFYSNYYNNII